MGIKHTLVTGMELTKEYLDYRSGGLLYDVTSYSPNAVAMNPSKPPSKYWGNKDIGYDGKIKADTMTQAFYIMDNIKFDKHWQLDLSVRQDHYKSHITKNKQLTEKGLWQDQGKDTNNDKLFSYRTALIFKPVEYGSIYASFSTARQPQSIRIITSGSLGEDLSPIKGKTYELGTKWDLFHERLSLSAALFRTQLNATGFDVDERTNQKTDVVYSYKQRTKGVELGAAGNITDKWSIYAGYAYMDSEVDGQEGWDKGITLPNTPRNMANLWTTYQLPLNITVSYGIRYVDERAIPPTRGTSMSKNSAIKVPSYSVHDAAVEWQANKNLNLRLNINNIFNKHYWRQYNGRGFGVPGVGQGAQLTAEYRL